MAERTVYICDRCGKEFRDPPGKVWIQIDRKADAAGGMEDVGPTVDCCPKCAIVLLNLVAAEAYRDRVVKLFNQFSKA